MRQKKRAELLEKSGRGKHHPKVLLCGKSGFPKISEEFLSNPRSATSSISKMRNFAFDEGASDEINYHDDFDEITSALRRAFMPDYGHGKPDSETLPLLSSRFKKKRREGAEQAWLYHSAGLWGLICHWNGTRNAIFRRETLEDILQETCLAFTGNAMSGNIKYRQGDLGPYLRTIALFKFVDVLRRHKRDQAINVDIAWEEVAAGEGDDPTVPASAVRWNQILRDILRYCDDKKLPHRRRTVLKAATIWFAANGCWPPIPKLTDLINADPDQKGELTKRQVSYAFNEALVGLAKHLKDKGYRD